MIDDLPKAGDRSELLNGKNPIADARLMAAVTRGGTDKTRIHPARRASTPQGPAPKRATKPKGISRNSQKITRGVNAR